MKKLILITTIILSGCAAPGMVVDLKGVDTRAYNTNYSECAAIVDQNSSATNSAASGAAIGAGIFAITGALLGVDVGSLAAIGAIHGAAGGLGKNANDQRVMMANCLRGRGYKVML